MNILGYTLDSTALIFLGAVAIVALVFLIKNSYFRGQDVEASGENIPVLSNGEKLQESELVTVITAAIAASVEQEQELAAVITAAIAASIGTESNGLVVRSIKRIPKRGR